MSRVPPLALLVGVAVPFVACMAFGAWALGLEEHADVVRIMLVQGAVYAAAVWLVAARPELGRSQAALALIVGVGVLGRAVLLPLPPVSTDIYRYVWDGRVQGAGTNPYRYKPADAAVGNLRDGAIYPNINRRETAVTIYPPAAQVVFLAVTRLAETVTAMKLAMVAFEAVAAFAMWHLLRSRRMPASRILIYLWHPLPLYEIAGSGHVDAVALGAMMLAVLLAEWRQPGLAGMALGFGVAAKFFPAFIAPALYRRWGWRMPAACLAAIALCYAPYLGVGRGVFGFLGGYAEEEGLSAGGGVFWLSLLDRWSLLPPSIPPAYLTLAAIGLVLLAARIAFRSDPERVDLTGALVLIAAVTAAVTPHYPWYLAWGLPFLCLNLSLAVLWLTLAAPLLYNTVWPYDRLAVQTVLYLPAAMFLVGQAIATRRSRRLREIDHGPRAGHP